MNNGGYVSSEYSFPVSSENFLETQFANASGNFARGIWSSKIVDLD